MVTQKLKESLRKASMKYAEVKENDDLEKLAYFNPHKIALMRAYEAGFKAALITLNDSIECAIKEISK